MVYLINQSIPPDFQTPINLSSSKHPRKQDIHLIPTLIIINYLHITRLIQIDYYTKVFIIYLDQLGYYFKHNSQHIIKASQNNPRFSPNNHYYIKYY